MAAVRFQISQLLYLTAAIAAGCGIAQVRSLTWAFAALITAIVLSIPVGVWMSRSVRIRQIITPVLDLMQTLPSFVYLIPTVMIFGPGKIPALIATIVYAAPPLVRLTDLGLRSVVVAARRH